MRMASQPFIVPKAMQASAPPVTAHVAPPERTRWNASPIAWVAEAHALATAKQGPRSPQSMETWLAGAFNISLGMVSGWSRFAPSPIKPLVALILGRLAPDPGADDCCSPFGKATVEGKAGMGYRLARSDHREL